MERPPLRRSFFLSRQLHHYVRDRRKPASVRKIFRKREFTWGRPDTPCRGVPLLSQCHGTPGWPCERARKSQACHRPRAPPRRPGRTRPSCPVRLKSISPKITLSSRAASPAATRSVLCRQAQSSATCQYGSGRSTPDERPRSIAVQALAWPWLLQSLRRPLRIRSAPLQYRLTEIVSTVNSPT